MKKISVKQIIEAERTGRELTPEQKQAMDRLRDAMKPAAEALRKTADIIKQLSEAVRIAPIEKPEMSGIVQAWREFQGIITGAIKRFTINTDNAIDIQNGWIIKNIGFDLSKDQQGFVSWLFTKYRDSDFSVLANMGYSEFEKELLLYADHKDKINQEFLIKSNVGSYTHREHAIAENYKIEAGYLERMAPTQVEKKHGAKRKQAFYSINPMSEKYIPVKESELKKAIELLDGYPNALSLASAKLKQLQNS